MPITQMHTTPPQQAEFSIPDISIVKQALKDWQSAQMYLDWVTDSSLIDLALFWERAARLRYMYLLHWLKKDAITLDYQEIIRQALIY